MHRLPKAIESRRPLHLIVEATKLSVHLLPSIEAGSIMSARMYASCPESPNVPQSSSMPLTAELLGSDATPDPNHVALAKRITARLIERYGTPRLGNYKDPVKEIFYILLSARTAERLYIPVTKALFKQFPTIAKLAEAHTEVVYKIVRTAGFGRKRAAQIVGVAQKLTRDFPGDVRKALRRMGRRQLFDYLVSLPGVGPKSALCTMMYSFKMDVFPVDINIQRIAVRLGMLPPSIKHYKAQRLIPHVVPTGSSFALHVGMIEHGRQTCLPQRPKCDGCCLSDLCIGATSL